MAITIRIYGAGASRLRDLEAAFRQAVPGARVCEGAFAEDCEQTEVYGNDVLLCCVDRENAYAAYAFLSRVMRYHGAFGYLATVVYGADHADESLHLRERIYRLGATAYLDQATPPAQVVRWAEVALQRLWWSGVRQQELSALVVDQKGLIIRVNDFATRNFSPVLLGQPYAQVIEGRPGADLPSDHPILRAWERGVVISEDRLVRSRPGQEERHFLICSPLRAVRKKPWSTAVLLLDMSRWHHIVHASTEFSQVANRGELYGKITEQAGKLGFTRVRLYEYLEGRDVLCLRKTFGYADDQAAKLENHFEIEVKHDKTSQLTRSRHVPHLYVQHPEPTKELTEGTLVEGPPGSIVTYYVGPPNFAEPLGKDRVRRWLEAPLWLPATLKEGGPRFWGKISIDPGSDSDHLNAQDIGDIALFSVVVSQALASQRRLEVQRRGMQIVRRASREIVAAVRNESLFKDIIPIILGMYGRVTEADVVLYREYDSEQPDRQRLVGEPWFRRPELGRRLRVPEDLSGPLNDRLISYFHQGRGKHQPFLVLDSKALCRERLDAMGSGADPRERAYLKRIRSELHIPVFQGDLVRGVVVAVSRREGCFSEATRQAVRRLMYVASSWIELARQQSGQNWMKTVLPEAMNALSELAALPLDDDQAFFAGLATLLSAHNGLLWNRVLIFNCENDALNSAELCYALGGLAHDQVGHRALQKKLAEDARYKDLRTLVRERIREQRPYWFGPGGQVLHDHLYELYVERPRAAREPIRFNYGPDAPLGTPPPAAGECDNAHPLRWLLTLDYATMPALPNPLPIPINNGVHCQWVLDMKSQHPGLFDSDRTIYAFLLRCAYDLAADPLGVVLVDIQQHPSDLPRKHMIEATAVLLGLVSDLLASRHQLRRLRGWHKALPAVFHRRDLYDIWNDFQKATGATTLNRDAARLQSAELIQPYTASLLEFVRHLEGEPEKVKDIIGLILEMHDKLGHIYTEQGQSLIRDLGEWLKDFCAGNCSKTVHIHSEVDAAEHLSLGCDPMVLRDALKCLFENSVEAVQKGAPGRDVRITVRAELRPASCANFGTMLHLLVSDNGAGVDPGERPYVFIQGHSGARPPRHKGRGLAIVKAQLTAYHGDLVLVDSPPGVPGATFDIRFGIPPDLIHSRKEERRDQTAHTR